MQSIFDGIFFYTICMCENNMNGDLKASYFTCGFESKLNLYHRLGNKSIITEMISATRTWQGIQIISKISLFLLLLPYFGLI